MKAMLLCAGTGERMRPLSATVPKPAIPVLGRPMATQILRRLADQGVERAVVNLYHLPEVIERVLGDGTIGLPAVEYSRETTLLGTGGGIRRAAPLLLGEGPIVISNSDYLADIELRDALEAHRGSGCLATLVLAPQRPGYSTVDVDSDGRVLALAGQPDVSADRVAGRHLFTGLHIIEEELLERIPEKEPCHIVSDVYVDLAAEGRLGSFFHEGFWWEFGTPETYLRGSLLLLDQPAERLRAITEEHDTLREVGNARIVLGAGATVHDSARMIGHAAIGLAAQVSHGALIEDSVVMPEAWIGPDCRVRRSIIGQGVELPAGFEADGLMICADNDREARRLPIRTTRTDGVLVYRLTERE